MNLMIMLMVRNGRNSSNCSEIVESLYESFAAKHDLKHGMGIDRFCGRPLSLLRVH
jgi:hypothetical protein